MKNRCIKYKIAAIIFVCAVFSIMENAAVYAQEAKNLIDKECIRCHSLERVYYSNMSVERWDDTVRRMHSKRHSRITEQQLNQIVSYLGENNFVKRKQLFEKKCFYCHERYNNKKPLFLKKTKLGWKRAIERMRKKYCMFIGIDEAEEITVYWTDIANNKNIKLDDSDYDRLEGVFENKCGACHSYKFLYKNKYNLQDWHLILDRMHKKSPIIIKESDLQDIKDYLLQTKSLLVK